MAVKKRYPPGVGTFYVVRMRANYVMQPTRYLRGLRKDATQWTDNHTRAIYYKTERLAFAAAAAARRRLVANVGSQALATIYVEPVQFA